MVMTVVNTANQGLSPWQAVAPYAEHRGWWWYTAVRIDGDSPWKKA